MPNNFYHGKRVLVAGGTGTIGMAIVSELQNRNAIVLAVALDNADYATAVLPKNTNYQIADLTDKDTCLSITKNMDVVFDMTGIKGSTLTNEQNYSRMFVNYLRFQTELMDACAKNGVNAYIFAGSQCEYPRMNIPKQEDTMWDALPTQNDKYSGLVKRVGEIQAQTYFDEKSWMGAKILRFSNVYGPGDDFNPLTAQVIPALIAKSFTSQVVPVHGDGSAIRDFIFSEDAAWWAIEAAERLPACMPTNISSGTGISIRNVCDIISKFINVKFEFMPGSYSGDPIRILATNRAEKLLGFYQKTSFLEGIEKTINWYKNNKSVTLMKGKYYDKR